MVAVAVVLLSLAYVFTKIFDRQESIDFKYIWLAGDMWRQGVTPYGEAFHQLGAKTFWYSNIPTSFYYPPSWYPLAIAFSALGFAQSAVMWRIFSGVVLMAALAVFLATSRRVGRHVGLVQHTLFIVFVLAGSSAAHVLSTGQTSILILLGLALFLRGYVLGQRPVLCAGLVLLMLKPNFGLPFVVFCMMKREWRLPVAVAGIVSIAMAVPALVPGGLSVIKAYLATLGQHGLEPVNAPGSMTGLRNLMFYVTGADIGSYIPILLACAGAVVIARLEDREHARGTAQILALVAMSLFLVPLHTYDMVLIAPLALMDPRVSRWATALVSGGLLVIFRANNFAGATGLTTPSETIVGGTLAASLALALIAVGMAVYMSRRTVDDAAAKRRGDGEMAFRSERSA